MKAVNNKGKELERLVMNTVKSLVESHALGLAPEYCVFNFAQDALGVPRGTIRATVLIETIFGAFEMDEILYELRDHSSGLNCGRWDYMFSFIKKFRQRSDFLVPNRAQVTMDSPFLK